ncbi:secreted protein, putative [Psychroflexus torquis ATCC 700755]|uniref:Secreted protein, putative n=1 Tax=Psychroflexus torquis (strain ATCC 700755 / CIP 106069 / ACAM 623) TaxID=313595 RepID=K4ICI2_PSYTT|nr:GEVED domain-containing protein [Psychroflexus torquis]AFU67583.1 secreted protein, putative [Psychroflexus torquis ATCC 700755]
MTRITMTVFSLVFALTLNAQDFSVKSLKQSVAPEIPKAVLFDQSPDGTLTNFESIVSVVNNTGAGVYTTDDFTLDAEFNIQSITAYGFNSDLSFESTVTGINVYVYADSGANSPAGDPAQPGTGLLELVNIDPFGPAVEIISSGDGGFDLKVDIEAASGGSFTLLEGDYWLVVAPTQNIPDFGNATRWNWRAAGTGVFGNSVAHLIDPTNAFGGDFTDWTPFSGLGLEFSSVAFVIEGESGLDFPLPYCGPLEFTSAVEPMTNVDFAGISNRTDGAVNGTPAHEDFTSVSGDVLAGESYEIALQANTAAGFTNRFAVFVDWNQNDVLDDDGEVYQIVETITDSDGNDDIIAVQTLVVPANALPGKTRMRVKKIFGTTSYLDPCLGTGFGQTEDYSINVTLPLARLQVVHNSPDPAVEVVDVYVNGVLALDDFAFRTSTPFIDVPANTPLTFDIAPGTSVDVSESIFNVSTTLVADETYIAVASGTLDSSISLEVFAGAREAAAVAGNTDVLVHHGSPDAPTVDVVNQDGGGILVDDISYPEFAGYLELPTDDYLIDITTADGSTKVAGYQAYLAELGLADAAVTVFASGFLDPGANQDGPAFGLWVSLASGGALVELNDEDFILFPAPYCGPLEFSANVEPITNVEFAGFTNRTDATVDGTPAHEDFTSVVGQVSAGESYEIILEGNTAGGSFENRFAVFIDWNQNDVFDADEVYEITTTITGSTGVDGQQATQTLEVPVGAVDGQTRMRVKKIFGSTGYLDPCLGTLYGQAEEYTLDVGTVSNTSFDSTDFTYYPNPVNDILSISTASTVDNIKVYNMLGQMVVETAPKVSNPQVDMNELQSGVYLVTLEVEGSLQTFRVIKQ